MALRRSFLAMLFLIAPVSMASSDVMSHWRRVSLQTLDHVDLTLSIDSKSLLLDSMCLAFKGKPVFVPRAVLVSDWQPILAQTSISWRTSSEIEDSQFDVVVPVVRETGIDYPQLEEAELHFRIRSGRLTARELQDPLGNVRETLPAPAEGPDGCDHLAQPEPGV